MKGHCKVKGLFTRKRRWRQSGSNNTSFLMQGTQQGHDHRSQAVFPQAWICRESEKWQFIDERHTLSSLHIHCCHLLNPAKKSPLTLFKRRSVDTGIHPGHLHRRATILNAAECSTRTIASFENETALKHTQAVISVRWTNDTINSTRKSPLNPALSQVQRKTNKQR